MKIFSYVALISLAACVGVPTSPYDNYLAGNALTNFYHKAGVSFAQIQSDKVDCDVTALQRVPQNMVIQSTPAYTLPIQTYCNQIGNQVLCNQTGGQTYGGELSSTDANANLRARVFGQCMAQKNYSLVNILACPNGVDLTPQDSEPVLRPLSPRTCYTMNPSGWVRIGDG